MLDLKTDKQSEGNRDIPMKWHCVCKAQNWQHYAYCGKCGDPRPLTKGQQMSGAAFLGPCRAGGAGGPGTAVGWLIAILFAALTTLVVIYHWGWIGAAVLGGACIWIPLVALAVSIWLSYRAGTFRVPPPAKVKS